MGKKKLWRICDSTLSRQIVNLSRLVTSVQYFIPSQTLLNSAKSSKKVRIKNHSTREFTFIWNPMHRKGASGAIRFGSFILSKLPRPNISKGNSQTLEAFLASFDSSSSCPFCRTCDNHKKRLAVFPDSRRLCQSDSCREHETLDEICFLFRRNANSPQSKLTSFATFLPHVATCVSPSDRQISTLYSQSLTSSWRNTKPNQFKKEVWWRKRWLEMSARVSTTRQNVISAATWGKWTSKLWRKRSCTSSTYTINIFKFRCHTG